jgi:hypothetical protein
MDMGKGLPEPLPEFGPAWKHRRRKLAVIRFILAIHPACQWSKRRYPPAEAESACNYSKKRYGRSMRPISQDRLKCLLETDSIPGSPEQLRKLCVRLGELVEMNGEGWVRENREALLEQWSALVKKGWMR